MVGNKRKATKNIFCERPSKLIHGGLKGSAEFIISHTYVLLGTTFFFSIILIGVENITTTDVNCFRKGIYEACRKILPAKPTIIQEVHDVLRSIDIKTNKGEQFLLINDNIKNFILFSRESNLRNLSSISHIYVDGTF